MQKNKWQGWLILVLLLPLVGWAQKPAGSTPPVGQPARRVDVRWSDNLRVLQSGPEDVQKLIGNVLLKQDSIFISCDSAIIVNGVYVYAYSRVVIQQGDSLNVFADKIDYDGTTKLAKLLGNVVLDNNGQRLFTTQLDYDVGNRIATYTNGATLANDSTQLTSRRGVYFVKNAEIFFQDQVKVVDNRFWLKADTLKYNTTTRTIFFQGPTLIQADTGKIYCESGYYDTYNRLAEFRQNAQYRKGAQEAVADTIGYDDAKKLYALRGNARIEDSTRLAIGQLIQFNEIADTLFLQGQAFYRENNQQITSEVIRYNRNTGNFATRGRSRISDPPQILVADQVNFEDATGFGVAEGQVYWQDTAAQVSIICERALYSKAKEYLKASGGPQGQPEMITLIDQDSMFLAADTLVSYRPQPDTLAAAGQDSIARDSLARAPAPAPSDSLGLGRPGLDSVAVVLPVADTLAPDPERRLLAYHHVRIFKKDFQAVCDSLSFSSRDSLFNFYQDPIIWSDTSQFLADTMRVQLVEKQIRAIFMRYNALIINQSDGQFFNQIKGRNVLARFVDGSLQRMDVFGNAEVVYYVKDDQGAYVGVNKTISSEMVIRVGAGNQIERITFINEPQAELTPMRQVNHEQQRLEGFRWEEELRPKSRADIYRSRQVLAAPVSPPQPPLNQ